MTDCGLERERCTSGSRKAGDGSRLQPRLRRAALLGCCLALGTLGGTAGMAQVQSERPDDTTRLADKLLQCGGIPGEDARLKCYDELARPLMGLEEEPGAGEGVEAIHRFTGTDDWDSEPFEVNKPWRVVWQNQGSLLTVELRTEQNEMVDVIGNQIGRGGGRSDRLDPGVYRLAVRGLGGWRVQVVGDEQ